MYVNDGSKDETWNLIKEISKEEKLFTGISLSRNRGHQNALLAGLLTAKEKADVIIRQNPQVPENAPGASRASARRSCGKEKGENL